MSGALGPLVAWLLGRRAMPMPQPVPKLATPREEPRRETADEYREQMAALTADQARQWLSEKGIHICPGCDLELASGPQYCGHCRDEISALTARSIALVLRQIEARERRERLAANGHPR